MTGKHYETSEVVEGMPQVVHHWLCGVCAWEVAVEDNQQYLYKPGSCFAVHQVRGLGLGSSWHLICR